jgi:hypothetical protein
MKPIQILGVVVLVVGVILLGFAYHASNAPLDQLSNTLTGRFTHETLAASSFWAVASNECLRA